MIEDTRLGKELMAMGSRRVILDQIAHRFDIVPDEIRRRLERIYDPKRLVRIAGGLLEVNNLKQLQQLIDPNGKSTAHGRNGLKKKGIVKAPHGVSR